jgi:hypothetical protein
MHSQLPIRRIPFFHGLLLSCIGFSCANMLSSASTPPDGAVSDEVTEMPRFVVESTRILPLPEHWRYATMPGFEILSNASDGNTTRFLKDFQMLRSAIDIVWPGANQSASNGRSTIILCGKGNSLNEFIPEKRKDDERFTSSVFLQDADQSVIAVDLRAGELKMENNEAVIVTDPYRIFYEEYFRFLIRRGMGTKPPVWLEEGLVSIFSSIEFTNNCVEIGKIDNTVPTTTALTSGDDETTANTLATGSSQEFTQVLSKRAIIPFGKFFTQEKPSGMEGVTWKAQAYGFAHMCMYGNGKRYQKAFLAFATRACHEPISESLFKECFGQNFDDMALELRSYIEFTAHEYIRMKGKQRGEIIPKPGPVVLREATDSESGRLKGNALRMAGRLVEAENTLIAPYVRGERDPRLLAALGMNELSAKRLPRARKFLEAAFLGKVSDARPNVELARMRLNEVSAGQTQIPAEKLGYILEPLERAASQTPVLPDCVQLLSLVWLNGSQAPSKAQMQELLVGIRQNSSRPQLVYLTAQVCQKYGYDKEAAYLSEWGQSISTSQEGKALFKKLRESIPYTLEPAKK